jgi:hypothetical protein
MLRTVDADKSVYHLLEIMISLLSYASTIKQRYIKIGVSHWETVDTPQSSQVPVYCFHEVQTVEQPSLPTRLYTAYKRKPDLHHTL